MLIDEPALAGGEDGGLLFEHPSASGSYQMTDASESTRGAAGEAASADAAGADGGGADGGGGSEGGVDDPMDVSPVGASTLDLT
jgi:hypothetical protein